MLPIAKAFVKLIVIHRLSMFIATVFVIANIFGCAGVPIIPYVSNEIRQKSDNILIGKTTRDELRELYGKPIISSDYYRFDVFVGKCSHIVIVPILIFPVPGVMEERCSALVKYKDNVVANFDASSWSYNKVVDDLTYDQPNVVISWKTKTNYDKMNNYDDDKSTAGKCKLFIAPISQSVKTIGGIFVDKKYVGHGVIVGHKKYFHHLIQEPGKHRLAACYYTGSHVESERHCEAMEYECPANGVVFISPKASDIKWSSKIRITFDRLTDFSSYFDDGYLIIGQTEESQTILSDH